MDEVIAEPLGGAHQDQEAAIANLRDAISRNLDELSQIPTDQLLAERYDKFRRVGFFSGE